MAKKPSSFADKAARGKEQKDYFNVKFVNSIPSEKTGHWRFKEQIIRVKTGENVQAAIQRLALESQAAVVDIPVIQPKEITAPVKPEPGSEVAESESVAPVEEETTTTAENAVENVEEASVQTEEHESPESAGEVDQVKEPD